MVSFQIALAENISIIPLKKPNLTLEEIEEKISKNILKPLKKPKKIKDLKKIEIIRIIKLIKCIFFFSIIFST